MFRNTWLTASILSLSVAAALAGQCRAADQEEKDQSPAKDLPAAVLETALYHVPDLTVDDVSTRQVQGHPLVYIIDGQCCDRSVMLSIDENGDVHEIRFHKHPDGIKPTKIVHSLDELPALVRDTAERVVPNVEVADVKSSQAEGEQRIYHLTGTVMQDDQERHITLTIEEDGDLLEARVFKPMKEVAATDYATPDEATPRDPNDD